MLAITSLSLKSERVDVQREAIKSWRACGCRVQSMNHPEEIAPLADTYDVEFVPCFNETPQYGRYIPYNAIIRHVLQTPGQFLFVNSDIILRLTPAQFARFADACKPGLGYIVRHNHDGNLAAAERELTGIDAWISDPSMVKFPESFLSVGRPGGDYWFPAEYLSHGLPLFTTDEPIAFHRRHRTAWNQYLLYVGIGELCRLYGYTESKTNEAYMEATLRLHTRIWQAQRIKVLG